MPSPTPDSVVSKVERMKDPAERAAAAEDARATLDELVQGYRLRLEEARASAIEALAASMSTRDIAETTGLPQNEVEEILTAERAEEPAHKGRPTTVTKAAQTAADA
jgi:hypothetical protein